MRLDIVHLSKEKYTISDEFRSSVYTVVFPPGSSDTLNVIKAGQAEDEAIAKVVFRILRADSVIFRGKERSAGDWLQKKLLSSTRTWVAMSERRYSWAAAGVSSLTLKNANGEDLGRSHNASRGFVGKEKHVAFIELSDADEVFADLDEIIVTWVYLKEKEKRDRGEID